MKDIKSVIQAVVALLLAHGALAQVPADTVDASLQRCLNNPENAATSGQTGCLDAAEQAYDARMNAAYGALMRLIAPQARAALRQSQRGWIAYRDLETTARNRIYGDLQGTLNVSAEAYEEMAVIRDRALLLEGYLRVVKESDKPR